MVGKFRYDINALRAIAVIGVVAFHYKLTSFAGGFCGVDIFFVISGYLMSRNILNEIDNKSFSVFQFYSSRFKRIVPALLFLVIIVSFFGFFFYFPNDFLINERNATASLLFFSNIFYWKNSSYFDPASDTNIFLHTWSLSVEWQFYMLYPIILILFKRIKKNTRALTYLFTIVTVLLCIASILYTPTHEKSSFYMLPTRSWEMMFGGLAFMIEGKISRLKLKKIVNICGYIAITLSFILVNTDMEWPGLFTLFPVCGTFLIISTNLNRSIFIKHEIVQFVGKISYSLYLWHWPIYVASNYMGIEKNNLSIIILIFISFLFAVISFKFIESTHMRRVKLVSFIMTFTLICTLTLSYFN